MRYKIPFVKTFVYFLFSKGTKQIENFANFCITII